MVSADYPSEVIELMATFGRQHKASPASNQAGRDTDALACDQANEARVEQALRLRTHHLKPTIARISVLVTLEQAAPQCLDTTQLLRILISQVERLSTATVYRALSDLWQAGLLVRNWGDHGRARYGIKPAGQSAPKDTLACHCGTRLVFIEDPALREHLCSLAGEAGFDIDKEPAFTISMACAGCRNGSEHGR
jgi:Fur family ferric uptake transcriptional regulator